MGSSRGSRNISDQSLLKRLRSTKGSGGAGGGTTSSGSTLVCLPSFTVPIKQLTIIKKGLSIVLRDGKVYLSKMEIGTLSARQYRMVVSCGEEGIAYRGVIAAEKKQGKDYFYGVFTKYRL